MPAIFSYSVHFRGHWSHESLDASNFSLHFVEFAMAHTTVVPRVALVTLSLPNHVAECVSLSFVSLVILMEGAVVFCELSRSSIRIQC